ncbi:hypothetical protein [Streptomyces sp. NBC_01216]|uniref:hypothetical protein n=1 Tax=unclassified Streptomyces TaxID=2593676 RepID=UPI002E15F595|nr:hypothetical protein OG393_12370 [Streptomyces sp. NBC_01216]
MIDDPGIEGQTVTRGELSSILSDFKKALEAKSQGPAEELFGKWTPGSESWNEAAQDVYFSNQWFKWDMEAVSVTPDGLKVAGKTVIDFQKYLVEPVLELVKKPFEAKLDQVSELFDFTPGEPSRPVAGELESREGRSQRVRGEIDNRVADAERVAADIARLQRKANKSHGQMRENFIAMRNIRTQEFAGLEREIGRLSALLSGG